MTKPDSFNPLLADPELLQKQLEPLANNVFKNLKKPGPVRALPFSDAHWAKLEAIRPYPESPIHD